MSLNTVKPFEFIYQSITGFLKNPPFSDCFISYLWCIFCS